MKLAILFFTCVFFGAAQFIFAQEMSAAKEAYKYVVATGVEEFAGALNEAGKNGYRLEFVAKYPVYGFNKPENVKFAAIFRADSGNTYEYESVAAFAPEEIVSKIAARAKDGFYFRESMTFRKTDCYDDGETSSLTDLTIGTLFFLERKNSAVKQHDYRVAYGEMGMGKNPTKDFLADFSNSLDDSFRPVELGFNKILNSYTFLTLMEKSANDAVSTKNAEYRIVRTQINFEKKLNKLAADGYRLKFAGQYGAIRHSLMVKDDAPAVPRLYSWIRFDGKNFQSELAQISGTGAKFSAIESDATICNYLEGRLVFEKTSGAGNPRYEYLTLKMSEKSEKPSKNNPFRKLAPPTAEQLREFQTMLAKGYRIREMFYADGIQVLFEKEQN